MNFDLSKFRKVSTSKTHTELAHPSGHTIKLDHSKMTNAERQHLNAIPIRKYAEGGEVDGYDPELAKKDAITPEFGTEAVLDAAIPSAPEITAEPVEAPSNYQFTAPGQPSADPSTDPYGYKALESNYRQGIEQSQKGIQQEAAAQSALGQQKAVIAQEQAQRAETEFNDYKAHYAELEGERKAFQTDLANQHVDPNHYMNSMDTGGKIATAIGMILGGLGGNANNPVIKFVENQIDRDIAAQKANLGKQQTLLEANLRQFGNLDQAIKMTKVMMNDIMAAKFEEAAGKSADPLAQARAMQAAGDLRVKSAPILAQLAAQKTAASGMQAGKMDPARAVAILVPKERQGEAMKELKEMQNRQAAAKTAVQTWDKLNGQVGGGVLSPSQRTALVDPLAVTMARDAAGRVNEYEFKAFKELFPAPMDSQATRDTKRSQLVKILNEKMHSPQLEAFGIRLPSPILGAPNKAMKK